MHIRQIYFGNVGYSGAWLPPQVLDLFGSHDVNTPSTVALLENGGGKTSMIALLLSIFQPHQSRFLGMLREDLMGKREFTDYLSADGLPGIVAAEMVIPHDMVTDRHVVCGYVAQIRDKAEGETMRRKFFVVEFTSPRDADRFLASMPGLGGTPYPDRWPTAEAWLKQIETGQAAQITQQQRDWRDILRQARIDVEIFDMLIDANMREGLVTVGVVQPGPEEEFVAMLLRRSLEPEALELKYDGFKSTISDMRDLNPLTAHEKTLGSLDETAAYHSEHLGRANDAATARDEADALISRLAGRAATAADRARHDKATDEATLGEARTRMEAADKALLEALQRKEAAQSALLADDVRKREAEAAARRDDAEKARRLEKAVRAAMVKKRLETHAAEAASLEETLMSASQGLDPLRERLKAAQARFAGAVVRRIRSTEAQISAAAEAESTLNRATTAATCTLGELRKHRDDLLAQHATAASQVKSARQAVERCISEGHLKAGEDPSEALDAARQEVDIRQRSLEATEAAEGEARSRLDDLIAQASEAKTRAAEAKAAAASAGAQREHADREKAGFESDPDLLRILEADAVDPLAGGVMKAVDRAIQSQEVEVGELGYRLQAAMRRSDSVDRYKVAVESEDVIAATLACVEAGIGAMPFGQWLAEARSTVADEIVRRRPELLYGVAVPPHQMDKAASAVEAITHRLGLAVWISPMADPAQMPRGDALAVIPGSAASWNSAVAQETVSSEAAAALSEKHATARARLDRLKQNRTLIEKWRRSFGSGVYEALLSDEAARSEAAAEAGEKSDALEKAAAEARRAHLEARNSVDPARHDLAAVSGRASALESLQRVVDEARPQEETARVLSARMASLDTEITACEASIALSAGEARDAARQKEELERIRESDRRELLGLNVGSADDDHAGGDIDVERQNMLAAENALSDAEKGIDPGLSLRLQQAREAIARSEEEFAALGVPDGDLKSLQGAGEDLGTVLEACRRGLAAADAAVNTAEKLLHKAEGAADSFEENRSYPSARIPCDPGVDFAGLHAEATECVSNRQRYAQETKAALAAAQKAADRTKAHLDAAQALAKSAADTCEHFGIAMSYDASDEAFDRVEWESRFDAAKTRRKEAESRRAGAAAQARKTAVKIREIVSSREFQDREQVIYERLKSIDDETLAASHERFALLVNERLQSVRSKIASHKQNLDQLVSLLMQTVQDSFRVLKRATEICIPDTSKVFPGERILKMRNNALLQTEETRRLAVADALAELAEMGSSPGRLPKDGAALMARLVYKVVATVADGLNIELIKPVAKARPDYETYAHLTHSGGELKAMAMMVFGLIGRLRGEMRYGRGRLNAARSRSSVLVLDNPFSHMTKADLWTVTLQVLATLGVQIFAFTGSQERSAQQQFHRMFAITRSENADRSLTLLRPAATEWIWPAEDADPADA